MYVAPTPESKRSTGARRSVGALARAARAPGHAPVAARAARQADDGRPRPESPRCAELLRTNGSHDSCTKRGESVERPSGCETEQGRTRLLRGRANGQATCDVHCTAYIAILPFVPVQQQVTSRVRSVARSLPAPTGGTPVSQLGWTPWASGSHNQARPQVRRGALMTKCWHRCTLAATS